MTLENYTKNKITPVINGFLEIVIFVLLKKTMIAILFVSYTEILLKIYH